MSIGFQNQTSIRRTLSWFLALAIGTGATVSSSNFSYAESSGNPLTISGKVLDGLTGEAVPGSVVRAYVDGDGGEGFEGDAETNPDGSFSITGVPRGATTLGAEAPGYRGLSLSDFDTSRFSKDTLDVGSLRIRPSPVGNFEYSGVLVDNTDAPIANIELTISPPWYLGIEEKTVSTDELGVFSFTGLTGGAHLIYVRSGDYVEDHFWFDVDDSITDARLVLTIPTPFTGARNGIISGKVMEYLDIRGISTATPVENACATAHPVGGGELHYAATDSNGEWSITGLMEGQEYQTEVGQDCSGTISFDFENKYEPLDGYNGKVMASADGGVAPTAYLKEISRSGAGSITGRVRDADSYSNVVGASVSLFRGGLQIEPTVTDYRGEYSFPNLPAGFYSLVIEVAPGNEGQSVYRHAFMRVEVADDANRVNVMLTRDSAQLEGQVSGTVVDEIGNPHASGWVSIWDPNDLSSGQYAFTDAFGRFSVKGLPIDVQLAIQIVPYWNLFEIAELFTTARITDGNKLEIEEDIALQPGFTVSGRVSGLPSPQSSLWVTMYAELLDTEHLIPRVINRTRVDSSGAYTLTRVPKGKYLIRYTQNSPNFVPQYWGDGPSLFNGTEQPSIKPVYWDGTRFGTTNMIEAGSFEITSQAVSGKNVEVSQGSSLFGVIDISTPDGPVPLAGNREIDVLVHQKLSDGRWHELTATFVSSATMASFQVAGLSQGSYRLEFMDSRRGNNALARSFNGGVSSFEEAPEIVIGEGERVVANHTMNFSQPETSAAAFDLDELSADLLSEIKDSISFEDNGSPGSELEIFVGTEFAGQFVSAVANSAPVALGDWKQVDSRGFIRVTLPKTLVAGSHRIAVQDARSVAFGWAPLNLEVSAAPTAEPGENPTIAELNPALSLAGVIPRTEQTEQETPPTVDSEKEPSPSEGTSASPVTGVTSFINWLLPLTSGLLVLVMAGAFWIFRSRKVFSRRT